MPRSVKSNVTRDTSLQDLFEGLHISDTTPETVTWSRQTTTVQLTFPRDKLTPSRNSRLATEPCHSPTRNPLPSLTSNPASPQQSTPRPLQVDPLTAHTSGIPKPSEIKPPAPDEKVQGYYVVTVGQEVGIFYTWADASERVTGVSGNAHQRFNAFADALELYTRKYEEGAVRVVLVPGSRIWRLQDQDSPPASTSTDSSELWLALEDLSEQMGSVQM